MKFLAYNNIKVEMKTEYQKKITKWEQNLYIDN